MAKSITSIRTSSSVQQSATDKSINQNINPKARKRIGEFDKPFFILVLALMVIGIVMMFSASYYWELSEGGNGFGYAKKQIMIGGVGVIAMLIISRINYNLLANPKLVLTVFFGSLGMLAFTSFFGIEHNGARRWLKIGVEFQPSEIMKFAIIILFAFLISKNYKKMKLFKYGILPFYIVLAVVAGLMMIQPHLSGTILIFSIGIIMIFVGGARIKHLAISALVCVIGLASAVLFLIATGKASYFTTRFQSWLNPLADVSEKTWQTYQSLIAIGSGGVFGMGIGESRQKYLYLPESKNDFVFSIVCEELGLIGAILVIALFLLFTFRGFYIASKAPDKFGMLLVVGLTVQISVQALLNIAVVTNTVPNTGISLPFFSYGGTALAMQLAQMGVILNVSRYSIMEE